MKYIYITVAISIISIIAINAQPMSLFLKANNSGWYPHFLNPVVMAVTSSDSHLNVLDIGTGPGKLPELLIQNDSILNITGIDIDTAYIDEAKRRVKHKNVSFQNEGINEKLNFKNEEFDVVTFCSVLFLLDDSTKYFLMDEALRVLKPNGKIIVLTPSGKKSRLSAFSEVWHFPYSKHNWTYLVWKTVTHSGGKKWQNIKWLENYSKLQKLSYTKEYVFNQNASIEIIINSKKP